MSHLSVSKVFYFTDIYAILQDASKILKDVMCIVIRNMSHDRLPLE